MSNTMRDEEVICTKTEGRIMTGTTKGKQFKTTARLTHEESNSLDIWMKSLLKLTPLTEWPSSRLIERIKSSKKRPCFVWLKSTCV
jgi:hypothetical protein